MRDLAPYIVFSALNVAQRPQHRFLAKLWHKNDVFDEKKVFGSPKSRPTSPRNSQADIAQRILIMYVWHMP